ncbi:hypothetical protein Tco_1093295 [Tanacetum coccineum]|uniref:Retrotransposon gag domain-containing protein n=1 Tax=Tanacetum coccineum TaxID=301880 RepID=A0ABQ5IES2_9ASTR
MTGPLINEGSRGNRKTPPLTREQLEGRIFALKSLIKEHNGRNSIDHIRLNFDEDEGDDVVIKEKVVVGKNVEDADLGRPFKESLRTPLTRRIIEFTGPEYKMSTNIKWNHEGRAIFEGNNGGNGRRKDGRNVHRSRDNYTPYRGRDHQALYPPSMGGYQGCVVPAKVINMIRVGHEKEKKKKNRKPTESWMNVPINFPSVSSEDISEEPIILEAEMLDKEEEPQKVKKEEEENVKEVGLTKEVLVNPAFPNQLVIIERGVLEESERSLPFFKTLKNITKENKDKYSWTEEAEEAFQEMKRLIMNLPSLTTPLWKETLYFAFGGHLEETHVTWAHLEKKRTRLQTYTNIAQEFLYSGWRWRHKYNVTPSQRRSRQRHKIPRRRDKNPIRTLGDYFKPSHEGYRNTIELPVGNNAVPLRSDTIRLVQNGCSFHGLWSEDPNQYLKDFLKLVESLDLDGENRERTRMQDLALYDNESWNDPKDIAKPVKAIALPQDVFCTSGRRLIELENQVQRLMEAHLASTQPT